jgi:hypothetical protein
MESSTKFEIYNDGKSLVCVTIVEHFYWVELVEVFTKYDHDQYPSRERITDRPVETRYLQLLMVM